PPASTEAEAGVSLVVCVKSAAGVVLATDSRRVISSVDGAATPEGRVGGGWYIASDDDLKLFTFAEPHCWVAVGVAGHLANRTGLAGLRPEIETALPARRLTVREYAAQVRGVLVRHAARDGDRLIAVVAGSDESDHKGSVFVADSAQPELSEHHAGTI